MKLLKFANIFNSSETIDRSEWVSEYTHSVSFTIYNDTIAHNEIGVIAPYHAQCVKIRKMLSGVADEVKVGSVEEFQGQVSKSKSVRRSVAHQLLGATNHYYIDGQE